MLISDQQNQQKDRYVRTARFLTIIVLAYTVQMLPSTISCIWDLFVLSPTELKLVMIIIGSMGGVFNGFAYTAIRIKMRQTNNADII